MVKGDSFLFKPFVIGRLKIEKSGDRKNSKFEIEPNQFFDVNSDDGAVWLKGTIDREALIDEKNKEAKINLKVGSFIAYKL